LVEDNKELRQTVSENLQADGYHIVTAENAGELLNRLQTVSPDTILLDLMLPDGDGLSLIARIRDFTDAPVIVISGKIGMVDKVVGLEMGADDYVAKPFEMRELSARVKANIRRYRPGGDGKPASPKPASPDGDEKISFGGLVLDRAKFQLYDRDGQSLGLTVMEFRLLEALAQSPNRVLSREQLLQAARQDNPDVYDRAIDVQITRIRKKIGDHCEGDDLIRTVRGAGYMFTAPIQGD
jgi:DNA-binding response OmpR family regulator